jgi:hypothetical protein
LLSYAAAVIFEELAGPRFDPAQGLNQEDKAVRKGKKRNSLTALAGHFPCPWP